MRWSRRRRRWRRQPRRPKPRLGILLLPARRDHGAVDSRKGGHRLRGEPHPRAADAVSRSAHRRQQHRQQARREPRRARARAGNLALLRAPEREPGARHGGRRSIRSPRNRSGRTRRYPSLEVATAQGHGVGSACERGYGCSYSGTLSFRNASTPLPIESNPRQAVPAPVRPGRHAARSAQFLAQSDEQHARHDLRARPTSHEPTLGPQDRATLNDYLDSVREIERRVHNVGARRCRQARAARGAGRDVRELRRAPEPDVRPDGARVSGRPDAHPELHDRRRGERADLRLHRRARRVPRALASRERPGEEGAPGQDPALSHQGVREVRRQARQDARRRRLDARPLDVALRQQHEQQQHAQPVSAADARSSAAPAARSRAASTSTSRSARRWRTCCSRCCSAPA